MPFDNLDTHNIMLYAYKNYDVPFPSEESFQEDFLHIKYVKKILNRMLNGGEVNRRLLINHVVILGNVFSQTAAMTLLFFFCDERQSHILKSVFQFLEWLDVEELKTIELDAEIFNELSEI